MGKEEHHDHQAPPQEDRPRAATCGHHPGPTVGYRITEDSAAVAYLPDHEPALGVSNFPREPDWTSGFSLAAGVNLLIHDAQYSDAEYVEHIGWGHSSYGQALGFAALAGVERMVAFHHDPAHDDSMLDHLIEEAKETPDLPFELLPGTEGSSFHLGNQANVENQRSQPASRHIG